MKFLRSAIDEIWSLFVDDPWFALSLALWAVVVRLISSTLGHAYAGPTLFGGFAVSLVAFTYRQASRVKK